MPDITDLTAYNLSMKKSLIDKMFFMDKIDDNIKVIMDYGCADGALIRFLAPLFPEIVFIGYDKSKDMLERAIAETIDDNVYFTTRLSVFQDWLGDKGWTADQCIINLSSVIHEVYSYAEGNEVEEFWQFVNEYGFKYIVIRDMGLDETAHRSAFKEDLIKVRSHYPQDKIREFESIHGSICDNYNLIHFLLKYRYTDNWDREVRENYLPITVEKMANQISSHYELIYHDHYILLFFASVVKRDFDITLKDYTHVKFIYRKKENPNHE